MGRYIRLTEEQYKMALSEELIGSTTSTTPQTQMLNGKPKINTTIKASKQLGTDYEKTIKQFQANGVRPEQVNVTVEPANESYVITKKELGENRLKVLKENSEMISVNDFLKRINKN